MKRKALYIFCAIIIVSTGFSQEVREGSGRCRSSRTGDCSVQGITDATNLSMFGWGIGLAAGIATLCALIPNNPDSSHSHSH